VQVHQLHLKDNQDFVIRRERTGGAATGDNIGTIEFDWLNGSSVTKESARFVGTVNDATGSSEDGQLDLFVNTNATSTKQQTWIPGSVVINEDSNDIDFRVESDGNANTLFVDGGNDRVGIGTATPDTALDVAGTVTCNGLTVDSPGRVSGSTCLVGPFVLAVRKGTE
jgi:hypothetical protein